MRLPWVSRKLLEAAEDRTRWTEAALRAAEEKAALAVASAETAARQVAALEAERKALTDRAFQMMGQPALYAAAPAAAAPAAPDASSLAGPKTRLLFEDIHERFREAERTGQLNLVKRA